MRHRRMPLGMSYSTSRLSPHREKLREWFAQEIPYQVILGRLKKLGCVVAVQTLSSFRRKMAREELQETVLQRIANGAMARDRVVKELKDHGTTDTATLIALLQNLVFVLTTQAREVLPIKDVTALMSPVMEWARLQLKEREAAVAERKVALLEEAAAKAREAEGVARDGSLTEEQRSARLREIFSIPASAPATSRK